MIVKVEFRFYDGATYSYQTMMFGDSYKSWKEQYREYIYSRPIVPVPVKAWHSFAKWIGWAGLKWCSEDEFQYQLNREGCQTDEPDNANPRQYSKMNFHEIPLHKLPDYETKNFSV